MDTLDTKPVHRQGVKNESPLPHIFVPLSDNDLGYDLIEMADSSVITNDNT
jgi:hypothetical protein